MMMMMMIIMMMVVGRAGPDENPMNDDAKATKPRKIIKIFLAW